MSAGRLLVFCCSMVKIDEFKGKANTFSLYGLLRILSLKRPKTNVYFLLNGNVCNTWAHLLRILSLLKTVAL